MSRDKFDFTDNELREIYAAISAMLNERNSYFGKGRVRIIQNLIKKLDKGAEKRTNYKNIASPMYDFDEEKDDG